MTRPLLTSAHMAIVSLLFIVHHSTSQIHHLADHADGALLVCPSVSCTRRAAGYIHVRNATFARWRVDSRSRATYNLYLVIITTKTIK